MALATVFTWVAATAEAADPAGKPDGTWISLTGTVVESGLERFQLDHGDGLITIEMDDWDWYDEASHIRAGDRVTVYDPKDRGLVTGRLDVDLFEKRELLTESTVSLARDSKKNSEG